MIRTSYGLLYGVPYAGATRAFTSTAFQTATPWVNTIDRIHPNTLYSDPFPNGYVYPPGSSQGLLSAVGLNLQSAQPSTLKTLYNQQWNFSIQRSLATDMMLQVAYVGNKGTHLPWTGGGGSAGMNMLPPSYSSLGNQLLKLVNNPFYGIIPSGPLAQPQVQYGQLLLPFPAWQTVAADGMAIGNSEYQSLQVSYNKRFSRGFSVIGAYTWSKLMTDVANGTWAGTASIRSYYCVRCEHSPSTYDVSAPLHSECRRGIALWQEARRSAAAGTASMDAFLGGWQANGILTLASGQPLVFATATNNSYTFGGGQHPDVVGDPVLSSGKSIYQWFNTAAFAQPANFTLRQHGANVHWRSPGQNEEPGSSRCSRISRSRSASDSRSGPKRST